MPSQLTLPQRFWSKVEFTETCWLWSGTVLQNGYGQVALNKERFLPHRWAYEFCVGSIPDGLTIDHLCRVLLCVNPDHLEAVTQRTNILRGNTLAAANVAKTSCPAGHPYDLFNTHVNPRGGRICRICDRLRLRRRRELAASGR